MRACYFLNYSIEHTDRTTETKFFNLMREADQYAKDNNVNGYLIAQCDELGNRFMHYVGTFTPSAIEEKNLRNIIGA